jgi:hypothetical protein
MRNTVHTQGALFWFIDSFILTSTVFKDSVEYGDCGFEGLEESPSTTIGSVSSSSSSSCRAEESSLRKLVLSLRIIPGTFFFLAFNEFLLVAKDDVSITPSSVSVCVLWSSVGSDLALLFWRLLLPLLKKRCFQLPLPLLVEGVVGGSSAGAVPCAVVAICSLSQVEGITRS